MLLLSLTRRAAPHEPQYSQVVPSASTVTAGSMLRSMELGVWSVTRGVATGVQGPLGWSATATPMAKPSFTRMLRCSAETYQ